MPFDPLGASKSPAERAREEADKKERDRRDRERKRKAQVTTGSRGSSNSSTGFFGWGGNSGFFGSGNTLKKGQVQAAAPIQPQSPPPVSDLPPPGASEPFVSAPELPVFEPELSEVFADEWDNMPHQTPLMPFGDALSAEINGVGFDSETIPFSMGKLILTNYRLGFVFNSPVLGHKSLQIPNSMIEYFTSSDLDPHAAPVVGNNRFRLVIQTKVFQHVRLYFADRDQRVPVERSLLFNCFSAMQKKSDEELQASRNMRNQFEEEAPKEMKFSSMWSFQYCKAFHKSSLIYTPKQPLRPEHNGWVITEVTKDYKRMGLPDAHFDLLDNTDFSICPTYPDRFMYLTVTGAQLSFG